MREQLQHKINHKTKPTGSLGQLEQLACQIGTIQNTLTPSLSQPTILVFAGDHGIAHEGVSAFPQEVTYQMVMNFLNGGAAINVFARQHNLSLKIIDAGVNFDFGAQKDLIHCKVGAGTLSFSKEKAMSSEQLDLCFHHGEKLIQNVASSGCNIVGFGEMGIGNTSAAAMIMSYICDLEIAQCVGKGTGVNPEQLENKIQVLQKAKDLHGPLSNPKDILQAVGGFEIAQIVGSMLSAFKHNMVIMVDGFIVTSAFLIAQAIESGLTKNAIFCHTSNESGHQKMLDFLSAEPILNLNMRLGEGTGCAIVYPIIDSAVRFTNEMASFEDAGVSNKE